MSTIAHHSLGQSLREIDAKSAGGMFARMWRTAAAQKQYNQVIRRSHGMARANYYYC